MADCEFIERFRLSRARIEWLVKEMKEELERNTARRSPLASEARVNTCICFIFKKLLYDPSVFPMFSTLSQAKFVSVQTAEISV